MWRIEYIVYNNNAFKHIAFKNTEAEARQLAKELIKLPHVTRVNEPEGVKG